MNERSPSEILVRHALRADFAAIMELVRTAPTAAQWTEAAYWAYCNDEFERTSETEPRRRALFVACARTGSSSTETRVGFAAFSALAQGGIIECELENIAVMETWRRRGLGRQLLAAGWTWLRDYAQKLPAAARLGSAGEATSPIHLTIWLEVRAGNTGAIAFYRGAGFAIAGRRPSYYSQPTEDAITMRKIL